MPLDKVVVRHLDEMDVLEDKAQEEVVALINRIKIDALIENPREELLRVVDEVEVVLRKKYYEESAKMGIEFANTIRKDGDIKIQRSKDPEENEGQVDLDLGQGEQT